MNPGALILMSAYLSLKSVVAHLVGKLLAFAVADRFRNIDCIEKVKCPVFFLHGKKDDLIPSSHSKELYNRSNIGEYWFPNKMTHNSFNILTDLLIPIDTFLEKYKIRVRLDEKECIVFPKELFECPIKENGQRKTAFMTSLYNKFFDK